MINAWSLAAEVLEGTLDETYPIKSKGGESPKSDERSKDDSDSK